MSEPVVATCGRCRVALGLDAMFCARCGQPRHYIAPGHLQTVIALYLALLGSSAAGLIYTRLTKDGFHAVVVVIAVFSVIIAGFAFARRDALGQSLSSGGWNPLYYLGIVAASVPIMLLVREYVIASSHLFGIKVADQFSEFHGHSVAWPFLLIAVVAPIQEEIAFRGVMYGELRRTLSVSETFIVSSFAFAILHLSVGTLVTHFPLALYFCWLRHRSGSVWPGVVAHACHNLGFCLLAYVFA